MSVSGKIYMIITYPVDIIHAVINTLRLSYLSIKYRVKADNVYKIFKGHDYNFKRTENYLKANIVLDDIIKDGKRSFKK